MLAGPFCARGTATEGSHRTGDGTARGVTRRRCFKVSGEGLYEDSASTAARGGLQRKLRGRRHGQHAVKLEEALLEPQKRVLLLHGVEQTGGVNCHGTDRQQGSRDGRDICEIWSICQSQKSRGSISCLLIPYQPAASVLPGLLTDAPRDQVPTSNSSLPTGFGCYVASLRHNRY